MSLEQELLPSSKRIRLGPEPPEHTELHAQVEMLAYVKAQGSVFALIPAVTQLPPTQIINNNAQLSSINSRLEQLANDLKCLKARGPNVAVLKVKRSKKRTKRAREDDDDTDSGPQMVKPTIAPVFHRVLNRRMEEKMDVD